MIIKDIIKRIYIIKGEVVALPTEIKLADSKQILWTPIDNPFEVYYAFGEWMKEYKMTSGFVSPTEYDTYEKALLAINELEKMPWDNGSHAFYHYKVDHFKILLRTESEKITEEEITKIKKVEVPPVSTLNDAICDTLDIDELIRDDLPTLTKPWVKKGR